MSQPCPLYFCTAEVLRTETLEDTKSLEVLSSENCLLPLRTCPYVSLFQEYCPHFSPPASLCPTRPCSIDVHPSGPLQARVCSSRSWCPPLQALVSAYPFRYLPLRALPGPGVQPSGLWCLSLRVPVFPAPGPCVCFSGPLQAPVSPPQGPGICPSGPWCPLTPCSGCEGCTQNRWHISECWDGWMDGHKSMH